MQPPFDPANPFGDAHQQPSGIGVVIDELSAEFAAKGMDATHTVALWLGKPNRFTSTVMRSPQEVLDYVTAELEEAARARATAHAAGDQDDDRAADPATPAPEDDERATLAGRRAAHREQEQLAGDAWRKSIRDRDAALLEWNKYVEGLRVAYNALKQNRPR